MADKNRGELRAAVREVLREPVAARWSDATINDYINNALEELARALMRTKTDTSSVDTETVNIPEDCLILNSLYWKDSAGNKTEIIRQFDDRVPLTNYEGDTDKNTGIPDKYWLINNVIYLRPIPDTAGTIEFEYYQKLPELASDEDVPALSGLNNYIKAHAVYEAFFDDGNPMYELWKQRRGEELASWMSTEISMYSIGFKERENW